MFRKIVISLTLLAGVNYAAHAASMDCELNHFDGIHITGNITGAGSETANKLFILMRAGEMSDDCEVNNMMYAYIDNDASAYDTVLGLASMAYAAGARIRVIVEYDDDINNVNLGNLSAPAKAYRIRGLEL